jgi:hypothetical protein
MRYPRLTSLAIAVLTAWPVFAQAQAGADVLKELEALKARITELEKKLQDTQPKPGQWGMTPEQAAEFNRISVKTEALEDNMEASGLKGLVISGYADPTYIYNKRQNRAGFQFLNRVDDDLYNYDNSYFGAAVIDFQKEMEGGTKWRLTLAPNRGVGAVVDGSSPVHEASVSIPLTDLQTRLIAGQIPDWSGYEYLPATQNPLITHNLLFDFTLPTAYTGAGIELTSGKWVTKAVLANMNGTRRQQGEKTPVVAYRVDYSRGEFQGFGFAGVHGKASNFRSDDTNPITGDAYDTSDTAVNLLEVDGYFIRGDWTVQGQVSFGQQKKAAITADPVTGELRDSRWWGASGLVAYNFDPRFKGIARLDYINNKKNGGGLLGYTFADDRNGIGPDPAGDPEKGANRMALSLGASYLFNASTTFKAEYRIDRANLPVFVDVKSGDFSKTNQLFGLSAVVAF